jgi:hypothetical protein
MKTISNEKIAAIRREKQWLGILYGILAGTGYALTAWGLDAYQLAEANAYLPWGRFAFGLAACLVLGGLAGWLASRLDNGLVAVLVWSLVGCALAIGMGWLTFQGNPTLMNWLYPDLASQVEFTSNQAIQIRTGIAALISALLGGAVGLLQLNLIDSALRGSYPIQRALSLWLGIIPFIGAGLIAGDGLIHTNLRDPILQVHSALQYAQEQRGQELDKREAREHGQTALRTLGDLQYQPYRLAISTYDEYLSLVWVMVDFGEIQTRCSVLEKQLSNCEQPAEITVTFTQPESTQNTPTTTTPPALDDPTARPASDDSPNSDNPDAARNKPVLLAEQASNLPDSLNRYLLNITIEPEQFRFQGTLQLEYTNMENSALEQLYFRLLPNGQRSYGNGSLNVGEVKVDGAIQPTSLSMDDSVLEVELGKSVAPGEPVQVEMSFQGQVPQDFGGSQPVNGYGIYNYTDGVMALANWYPILAVYDEQGWNLDKVSYIGDSVYSDMATYQVEVDLPEAQILVGTGVVQQEVAGEARKQYFIESGPVRDFFMILSPDFKSIQENVEGTLVSSYYLPGNLSSGQRALEVASKALGAFNSQFGPYPYAELDVVDAPMQNASGVEYPGIVLIGDTLYAEYDQPAFAVTVAHEIAHQWWYNLVGNDVIEEPWLDEAMATYASGLYLESVQGRPALAGLMDFYQERYQRTLDSSGDHAISESLAYFETSDPRAYGGIVYAKGALFLNALRQEIGDAAFFGALQRYFQDYRYQIATGGDLLTAFETSAAASLNSFYQTWGVTPQP